MLQNLEDTNPALMWLDCKYRVDLRLTNGQLIVVRFDRHTPRNFFNAEKIIKHYGNAIVANKETDYGEYLSVASTIADVLNQKMQIVMREVESHAGMSYLILDTLASKDKKQARQCAILLTELLLGYDPEASSVWGNWLKSVRIALGRPNEPKISLVVRNFLKELDTILIIILLGILVAVWVGSVVYFSGV